jgi:hypothetical protein
VAYNRTGQCQDLSTKGLAESADWLEKRVRFSVLSAAELGPPGTSLESGPSSSLYTAPDFASQLARGQLLNIEADAGLGMPIGQVGIPGIFGGASTVAAKREAIGDRFHAVLVDNGVMRLNECEKVQKTLTEHLGINLTVANASQRFLDGLKGIEDPEQKRKFIGKPRR